MNAENFAEWQCRQGHKVIRTASSYWHEAGPRVFQAFPYHWLITPSEEELKSLFLNHGVMAARFSTPIQSPLGKISYHIVSLPPYDLDHIRVKTRKTIVEGLSKCEVKPITLKQMAKDGWLLEEDTLLRQGRQKALNQKGWERLILSAEGIPGFQAFGTFVNGELASAILTVKIDDTYQTPYAVSHRKFMDFYVNHTLFYSVSCELLGREETKSIFFTVQSLDAPESVDEFKLRMGLQPKPVRQRVVLHPLLKPFASITSQKIIHSFARKSSGSFFPKLEGMLNFYLDGRLSIDKQVWPDCLQSMRTEILEKK